MGRPRVRRRSSIKNARIHVRHTEEYGWPLSLLRSSSAFRWVIWNYDVYLYTCLVLCVSRLPLAHRDYFLLFAFRGLTTCYQQLSVLAFFLLLRYQAFLFLFTIFKLYSMILIRWEYKREKCTWAYYKHTLMCRF